jgi:hypothetical protein
MKIGNVDRSKGAGSTKRTKGASASSGSAFADQLRGASSASGAAATQAGMIDHASLDGVDALLAMQEVGDAPDRQARKQARDYGEDLLDRLKGVQDALLIGAVPKEDLMNMAKKLRAGRASIADERINSVLDEIELRVEVEIAKLTQGL